MNAIQDLQRRCAQRERRKADRRTIAAERSRIARRMLSECRFCAHECGVNRVRGERGICRAGPETRFFSAQIEYADELILSPTFAIALSGCDLRCRFCITRQESWNPVAGQNFSVEAVVRDAVGALADGARSVMIFGGEPTIHLHSALELVSMLPDNATLIWKTNAHAGPQGRDLLEGLFDVWVADFKFGNDACAERLAAVRDYSSILRENLAWAESDSDLIVRHLLMPGHVECCWEPIAGWIASNMPEVKVSLRNGFWPGRRHQGFPELSKTTCADEELKARQIGEYFELNLIS